MLGIKINTDIATGDYQVIVKEESGVIEMLVSEEICVQKSPIRSVVYECAGKRLKWNEVQWSYFLNLVVLYSGV